MFPDPNACREHDVVDLRVTDAERRAGEVRTVLESAADVIFSDGVSSEFLDQWTFETLQLLEVRAKQARPPVGARR